MANKVNELSTEIKSKFGRQEACLLDYKQLGVAILSPHGREGWGLVDYAWSMLEIYPKDERDKLSLKPARHDVVICACGPQINMLEATKYNRGYLGIKVPGAGLEGLSRMPSYLNCNPKFLTFSEDIKTYPAAISSHSTTTALVLPLIQR